MILLPSAFASAMNLVPLMVPFSYTPSAQTMPHSSLPSQQSRNPRRAASEHLFDFVPRRLRAFCERIAEDVRVPALARRRRDDQYFLAHCYFPFLSFSLTQKHGDYARLFNPYQPLGHSGSKELAGVSQFVWCNCVLRNHAPAILT